MKKVTNSKHSPREHLLSLPQETMADEREFQRFKRWLFSLDKETLLDAMAFTFQSTTATTTMAVPTTTNNSVNNTSHEYDLLVEMVKLQPPPSTPVHPRAMGYKPRASQHGPKLDYTFREDGTLRWTQPRLFQWCVSDSNNEHDEYEFDNRKHRHHQHRAQRQPLPRQQRTTMTQQQQQRFDVLARKKVAPWGDCYSLGCTREQQEADVLIVMGTRLGRQQQAGGTEHTACFVIEDNDEIMMMGKKNNTDINKGDRVMLSPEKRILRMLQIASRGYFLSDRRQSFRNGIHNGTRSELLCPPPYCAPWLEPTQRWFSLSFYLASRYSVALWDSFHQHQSSSLAQNVVDSNSQYQYYPQIGRIPRGMKIRCGDWDKYDPKTLQIALIRAIQMGFQDLLTMEQRVEQLNIHHNFLRDGVLWSILPTDTTTAMAQQSSSPRMLLLDAQQIPSPQMGGWKAIVQSWTQVPLLEVHSIVQNVFRSLVCQKLEEQLIVEMEREMCREEEMNLASKGTAKVNGTTRGRTFESTQNGSRKIKKKKPKRNRRKQGRKTTPSNSLLPVIPAGSDEESDEESDTGEPERQLVARKDHRLKVHSTVDFPSNLTSPRDRNRNIILVLGILDDVMEGVYSKVGLPPTPAFVEDDRETARASSSSIATAKRGKDVKPRTDDETASTLNLAPKDPKRPHGSPASPPVTATEISLPQNLEQQTHHLRDAQNPWRVPVSIEEQALDYRHRSDLSDVSTSSVHSRQNAGLPADFYTPFIVERDLIFGGEHSSGTGAGEDIWSFVNRYQSRERSILTDFFLSRDSIFDVEDGNDDDDDDERLMAASTAASISSSNYKDTTLVPDADELEYGSVVVAQAEELADTPIVVVEDSTFAADMVAIREVEDDFFSDGSHNLGDSEENSLSSVEVMTPSRPDDFQMESAVREDTYSEEADQTNQAEDEEVANATSETNPKDDSSIQTANCRSPSPQAPVTPPPTLSPILVSLADLKDLKRKTSPPELSSSLKVEKSRKLPALAGPGSLPSSPIPPHKTNLTTSWSRDDLRIETYRDDFSIKQHRKPSPAERKVAAETPTYKSVAVKSLARPIASSKSAGIDFRNQVIEASLRRKNRSRDSCAQSETGAEGQREEQQPWHHEEVENQSVTRDETTTITSGVSQRGESEEIATIREERNAFRDMCLTLGAEVAKLRVMLSAQQATAVAPMDYPDAYNYPMYRPGSFDPNGMQPFYHGINNGLRPGPMSDAGFHRGGDHESQISEDEVYDSLSNNVRDSVRRMSSSHTMGGSDASIDFNNSNHGLTGGQAVGHMPMYDNTHFHGFQSRLTKDILRFLDASSLQLRKLSGRRKLAVERFSRLVKTIWPRSQVKLYGSYVSGLCLPSSDLDFVVCLPAVHKKDLALAPGVLEGRNAINETSQKLLARELKGESWIDPRSIKLIERTVVPVIKVSTKDTRARMIQLDISFDSPEHHGLEANQMVGRILEELPLIRPLMLVLKQFLLDRGLLTAYTGGLSSYCLFLMVARYLQEQPPSSGDCGSLLMGFLDFYGNSFDPRVTGVSVRRRQYFARASYALGGYETSGQRMWTQHQPHQQHVVTNLPVILDNPTDFRRRHNSFSDTGSVDGTQRRQHLFTTAAAAPQSTHRFASRSIPPRPKEMDRHPPVAHPVPPGGASAFDHARPFTFDPLCVEDPLSSGNNVGRNAFRINQVQRVFSDAHRALVASLEWEIHSSADGVQVDYPLLKCLLRGEDVLYEL